MGMNKPSMTARTYIAAQTLPVIIAECQESLRDHDETYPQFCARRAMDFADAAMKGWGLEEADIHLENLGEGARCAYLSPAEKMLKAALAAEEKSDG